MKLATDYADYADFNPLNPCNPRLVLAQSAGSKVGHAAGLDLAFPACDERSTLRPERAAAIQIFQDDVAFAALQESSHNGGVEAVLFDAFGARCGSSFHEVALRAGEIVLIERGLRKDQIRRIDRVSGVRMLSKQLLRVAGIESRFPGIGFHAI